MASAGLGFRGCSAYCGRGSGGGLDRPDVQAAVFEVWHDIAVLYVVREIGHVARFCYSSDCSN